MSGPEDPTPERLLRRASAVGLSLVAHFEPGFDRAGRLIQKLCTLSEEALGNLRMSGVAFFIAANDQPPRTSSGAEETPRLPGPRGRRELPATLRAARGDEALLKCLDTGEITSIDAVRLSRHEPSGHRDEAWSLRFDRSPRQFAQAMDPVVRIFITLDCWPRNAARMQAYVHGFFRVCAQTDACCGGLAEVEKCSVTQGSAYHDGSAGSVALDRLVNQFAWIHSGPKRRTLVRGVYWGNYLTARTVRRLGGIRVIRRNWRTPDSASDGPTVVEYPGKSVFLSLTREPPRAGYVTPLIQTAAWLQVALRTAGLLI